MKQEQLIHELAVKALQKHQIVELSRQGVYRSWRCGIPENSVHHFVITTIPYHLIVTGDHGALVLKRYGSETYDMLPWCRGSTRDTRYFAEKVDRGFRIEEFSEDQLREWVADTRVELQKERQEGRANEDWDEGCEDEYQDKIEGLTELEKLCDDSLPSRYFYDTAIHWKLVDSGDPPNWNEYTPQFLWCRESVRWFVEHHAEEQIYPEGYREIQKTEGPPT